MNPKDLGFVLGDYETVLRHRDSIYLPFKNSMHATMLNAIGRREIHQVKTGGN
jgi:hypothetical protein